MWRLLLTVAVFPRAWGPFIFPLVLIGGGLAAALAGLILAVPSFRTRGDYLAIVTLAFNMIVKSVLENIDAVGGPRGYMGMAKLTNLVWVVFWVLVTLLVLRNFIYSNLGRGVVAIREDELAANLVSVNTPRLKIYAFCLSAFFAGIAGGLYAHLLQFINPRSFSILKSTDMLVMVYLGGIGSLTGSILGATLYTDSHGAAPPPGVVALGGGTFAVGAAHDLSAHRDHGPAGITLDQAGG